MSRDVPLPIARGSASAAPRQHDGGRPDGLPLISETANQWTHAAGFLLSVVAAAVMLQTVARQPDVARATGCLIYVLSLMSVYAASTLSHSVREPRRLQFFQMLDQVCIFLLTAGSFTPFGLVHLREGAWQLILVGMWILCLTGILIRVLRGPGSVAFRFFAAIGWLPALALGHVYDLSGLTGLALVIAGGVAYTGGLWFLVNDHRHRYMHAAWHVCTIAGSACHFLFLQWYVAEWPLG